MKILYFTILLCFFLLEKCVPVLGQDTKFPEFERWVFDNEKGKIRYRLLKPKNFEWGDGKEYPLVLFFHGAGERGDDNETPLTHIYELFTNEENREDYPCFVIVPQCPENIKWVDTDWGAEAHTMPEVPSVPMQLSFDVLQDALDNYPIDSDRIYVTGLSMGGFGTWDAISREPDLFAAAVPVCGGGDEKQAEKIKNLPIWTFHGALDTVVKTDRTRNMIQAIQNMGGNPKYTEYPDIAHGSWKPAYVDKELLPWLFLQKKN